ncbi:hypothetical protein B0H19DRAFT_1068788 [Mycena capillaripes]|nr:hypothetical protein B0H19DRAFT_1068788 [Mycena capillaripes]
MPGSADSDDDELAQAMAASSPIRAPQTGEKRAHAMLNDGHSDDETPPRTVGPGPVNQNLTAVIQRFVAKKRLRTDQVADLEVFIKDSPAVREAKAYAQNLHLENMINAIRIAAPPWVPSEDLEKNINSYAAAVLLSVKLPAYKGNIPKHILFAILKKQRFDLPAGIEHNPANWGKVKKVVDNGLTQFRSKCKKAISGSLKGQPKERTNIFELTQAMVENTNCEVNVLLCARVAFMRKHFLKDPGKGYWDTVDKALVKIRKKADGDSVKISRAFKHILKSDRETHGVDDYVIEDTVDELQKEVDDLIGNAAVTAPGGGGFQGSGDEQDRHA